MPFWKATMSEKLIWAYSKNTKLLKDRTPVVRMSQHDADNLRQAGALSLSCIPVLPHNSFWNSRLPVCQSESNFDGRPVFCYPAILNLCRGF
jgi:hypothetical protein